MGAANVVPGVSGGTIALITGIYERLINALKRIDPESIQLGLKGQWPSLWQRVDGTFLAAVGSGIAVGVVLLARLLQWLLENHEQATFGFFFGLIAISIYSVGRNVQPWAAPRILMLIAGAGFAVFIATRMPAAENDHPLYLILCGIVAICSMILPGLSGSFVMILLGNYALVIRAVNELQWGILLPVAAGCAIGLLGFVQVVGWLFKRFPQGTLALMTGFILGSLLTIWPWKEPITRLVPAGAETREILVGYRPFLPDLALAGTWVVFGAMAAGAAAIIAFEWHSQRTS